MWDTSNVPLTKEKVDILRRYRFNLPEDSKKYNDIIKQLLEGYNEMWQFDYALSQLHMCIPYLKLPDGRMKYSAYAMIIERFLGRASQVL